MQLRRQLEDERQRESYHTTSQAGAASGESCIQEPLKLMCHPGVRSAPRAHCLVLPVSYCGFVYEFSLWRVGCPSACRT